ncbi:outer membrane beta-barrel protein [Maribellus maritimus]|uniref:outer membrane beta-barrel protein n=1 Tax=Maribellus maritimus TaxID=2870838 RepID=UPI001EEC32FA|nr:outer membrane beta-barrel protein [Maribellus maritimus]MCG6188413.1 PorT family protein [Maribellus maritimus]
MKPKKLIFSLLFIFPFLLNAQSRFYYGITAGGGLTGWHEKYNSNYSEQGRTEGHQFTYGCGAGVFVKYNLWKRFSIHSELLYLNSGSKFVDNWQGGVTEVSGEPFKRITEIKYRLHNVQIPISLSFDFYRSGVVPYLKLGVVPNYVVGGEKDYSFYLSTTGENTHTNEKLNFNGKNKDLKFEIKPLLGIGVSLKEHISAEVTLSMGESFTYYLNPKAVYNSLHRIDMAVETDKSYVNRSIMFMIKYNLN